MGIDLATLAAFVVTVTVISVVPGPDQLFIVATAMRHGRRGGLAAAGGMAVGMVIHTTAAVAGLSALLQSSTAALEVIRVAGAIYLIWLAIGALRSRSDGEWSTPARGTGGSMLRIARQATVTNLLNPKIVIFFIAFLPQFVSSADGAYWQQLLLLGAVFTAVGLTIDALVAVIAGTVFERLRRSRRVTQLMERLAATVYIALAARLVTDR